MSRHSVRSIWVQRSWGRMRVYLSGSGPPVLALHGLAGSGRYWQGLTGALSGRATIIAPDMAGFGASDKPDVAYDRGFHLDNLDAVADAVGLGMPGTVVRHSMGGILGALWAARHAGTVHSLALVATPYPATRVPRGELEARGVRQLVFRAVQMAWPLLTVPYRSSVYPRGVVVDYMRHTRASYWKTAYGLIWDSAVIEELRPLATVRMRCLLLYARKDRQVPLTAQEHWHRLLPAAQMEVLEESSHQLLLASEFAPLARWLDRDSV